MPTEMPKARATAARVGDTDRFSPMSRVATTEAATEKHLPVVHCNGRDVTVTVGEVNHPMLAEHSIVFVVLETKDGVQRKALTPGQEPVACFSLADGDVAVAAYAYCNLHGLWKTVI